MHGNTNKEFPAQARAFQPNSASGRRPAPSESSASRLRNERIVVALIQAGSSI